MIQSERFKTFLRIAFASAAWLCLLSGVTAPAEELVRPNVILILADDFGYECVGANGSTSYKTPHLDRLAAEGMRFARCYAQPLCTPTRVQLMTGIYNVRNYVDFGHMDPKATTFAHLLKRAGYATGIAGKWQLGSDLELPRTFGFDEHCLWQHTRRPSRYKNPGLEINGKQVDFKSGEYGPDIVNDWAIDFIRRHRNGPFFLYYPMMLTHAPFEPTPDSDDYADGGKEKKGTAKAPTENQHFGEMVAYLDKLTGKLVDELEALKLRDKTLILFLGDNGTGVGVRSKLGERTVDGGKGRLTAAGMHVPLIANWPGRIAGGRVSQDLVDTTDFLPTICEAAHVEVPADLRIDGRSFFPQLAGQPGKPRDWYYCWYAPQGKFVGEFAAGERYKLYRDGRLFDAIADPQERRPLDESALDESARAAKKKLERVLATYKDARPAHLTGR
jgi:arylsulfatase A